MHTPFPKDTLQKISLMEFGQVILEMTGDSRKIVGFYPTELVIPTFERKLMDGVLKLDDGTLMNIEFQTGNLGEEFLLRCAQYAVNLRVESKKLVETTIISTGLRTKSKEQVLISKTFPFNPTTFFYQEYDGLEKLNNIKNKIKNQEKLTSQDHYNLIFLPLMNNVDSKKAAFEVFEIANNEHLFEKDEQSKIKQCQYIVAQIVAKDDEKLLNKYWRMIKMINDFLDRYEQSLIDQNTKEVTEKVTNEVTEKVTNEVTEKVTNEVTEKVTNKVTRDIAKNFKDNVPDEKIAKCTGLSLKEIQKL